MQSNTVNESGRWRWPPSLTILLVLLVIAAPFIWTLASIQLRLSRNGAIANRLVESLHARFPGLDIRGVASYEREVLYISVIGHVEEAPRQDIEQWLRGQKDEQKIAAVIWLRVLDDADEVNTIRM